MKPEEQRQDVKNVEHLRIFKDAEDLDKKDHPLVNDVSNDDIEYLLSDANPKREDNPWKEIFTKHPNWKNMSYEERKAYVKDKVDNIEDVEALPVGDTDEKLSTVYTDAEGAPLSKGDVKSLGDSTLIDNLIKDKVIIIKDMKGNLYESRKAMMTSFASDILSVLPSQQFIKLTREPEVDSVLEYLCRQGVDKETAVIYAKNKLMKDALAVALSSETPVEFYIVLRLFTPQNRTLAIADDIAEVCDQYNMGYLDALSVLANRDISSKKNLAAFLKKTLKYHVDGIFKIYEMFVR